MQQIAHAAKIVNRAGAFGGRLHAFGTHHRVLQRGTDEDRPGNKDIQLSILYNTKRNLSAYPNWQEYFREQQPPMLITWGKNDGIFTVEGAELYKRELPNAELHFLDTGHFALEEEVDRIASLMHEFLDRTINKK